MRAMVVLLVIVFSVSCCTTSGNDLRGTRAIWLTNVVSDAMDSKSNIQSAVKHCHTIGINTIFPVVWNGGYTLYPSNVMDSLFGKPIDPKYAGRDPLQEIIDAAQPLGIRVIPWFEFGFSCSINDTTGGHIIHTFPHWKAVDQHGKIASKNGFQWMNAFHPEVKDFVKALVLEVLNNYEVDGFQGDDRLPASPSLVGYDSFTTSLYLTETGKRPPRDFKEEGWVKWRADKLNSFFRELVSEARSLKPNTIVSISPSIYPWSKTEYLQDWPILVGDGTVDLVCPQIYRYDFDRYAAELEKILNNQISKERHDIIIPGILAKVGSYHARASLLDSMVQKNRAEGIGGESYFYYEAANHISSFFNNIYQ